jgi:hypothetical protein
VNSNKYTRIERFLSDTEGTCAGEQVIDINTHPDGDLCSLPFVVLKILWNFPVQHTETA